MTSVLNVNVTIVAELAEVTVAPPSNEKSTMTVPLLMVEVEKVFEPVNKGPSMKPVMLTAVAV